MLPHLSASCLWRLNSVTKPGLLELLLHHIDVLTACDEVVETVWGVKHDLAASQAEQAFVGFTLVIVQHHSPAFVSLSTIRQVPTVWTEGQHARLDAVIRLTLTAIDHHYLFRLMHGSGIGQALAVRA